MPGLLKAKSTVIILMLAIISSISFSCKSPGPDSRETISLNQTGRADSSRQTITLVAAGDCLMHNTQIWSGLQKDGSYSFDTFFPEIKSLIEEGDYSSTNFEAPMAGPARGYTGYPLFNSPDAAADAFKQAGFDLVVTANNHIMDQGIQGALRTMQVLHQAGLDTVGTDDKPGLNPWLIKDIKGVKVGYLAYSYSTNGMPVPKDYSYFFHFLSREKVLADVKALRPQVDILVLVLHWGQEYNVKATAEQKALARDFMEAGADVILGSHPHVIEPMEVVKIGDQNKFVIYSMGNLISHQIGQERNSGVVLKIKFTKDAAQGKTWLQEVTYTPTFSHYYTVQGSRKFRVVPVEETINKIKQGKEPYLNTGDLPLLQSVLSTTRSRLGPGFIAEN